MNHVTQHVRENSEVRGTTYLSTDQVSRRERLSWLVEQIGRQYANVEIIPPKTRPLFNEMRIYPWGDGKLSIIRSSGIQLKRSDDNQHYLETDAIFFVIVLGGKYRLRQAQKEVYLAPGDISLYDVSRPHSIDCPGDFSKIIINIPGPLIRSRIPLVENYVATKITATPGIGLLVSNFFDLLRRNIEHLSAEEVSRLGLHSIDLLSTAVHSLSPDKQNARAAGISLRGVQMFIDTHLGEPGLNGKHIAKNMGLSVRYINELFRHSGDSLMHYVWSRRLENCRRLLAESRDPSLLISRMALGSGFVSAAHFSRAFKRKFGMSPRVYRAKHKNNRAVRCSS